MRGFILRLISFSVLALIVLEVFFRWVLPASDMPRGYQDPEFIVMLHDTTGARTGLHTMGRYCRPAYKWRINNYGANSAEDFKPAEKRRKPCIVAIGASYLQGLYSDVDEHLCASLQRDLSDEVAVYNLGVSGMAFSQCVKVAEFARHYFSPEMLIIQASHSSLRNSIRDIGFVPYSAQYSQADTGYVLRDPSRFHVSRKNRLLRWSAFVRYLFYNANLSFGGGIVMEPDEKPSGAEMRKRQARVDEMKREVLRLTLKRLQAENPGVHILVFLDTDRNRIYETGGETSPLHDSPIYTEVCAEMGVHFVDISQRLAAEYRANGRRFDFDNNYHWDPYGVSIIADEIAEYMRSSGLLERLLAEYHDTHGRQKD